VTSRLPRCGVGDSLGAVGKGFLNFCAMVMFGLLDGTVFRMRAGIQRREFARDYDQGA
jgi:hypothetical protein